MAKIGMNTQSSESEVNSKGDSSTQTPNSTQDNSSILIINHKLNGHNFLPWSKSVFMFICGKEKDDYLIGDIDVPTKTDPLYHT